MWVLLEETQTKIRGKSMFFKGWSKTGPELTDDLEEAHRFESKDEARLSAAYRDSLSFFEPVEVGLAVKNKAAA